MVALKKVAAIFYRSTGGTEPVREFLKEQEIEDRKILGRDIAEVEYGWPIGMPICRSLGHGLWEVRSRLITNRIARVIFAMHESRMVLLHAFIKKTQKTPASDIDLARERLKEIQR